MCKSRMNYYSQPNLLDYAHEDAVLMDTFFKVHGSRICISLFRRILRPAVSNK